MKRFYRRRESGLNVGFFDDPAQSGAVGMKAEIFERSSLAVGIRGAHVEEFVAALTGIEEKRHFAIVVLGVVRSEGDG